jgi:PIN domain nuclease of toxin-antitoxin system
VNGYLLDTNMALRALARPAALSARVRRALLAGPNVLSAVVYWEVLLKAMKGVLRIEDPRTWWDTAVEQLAATPLVLRPEHVTEVYALSPIHKDPFDRVLIAQATVEELTMLTTDGEVQRYASDRFKVMA